jgi:hypothetical protein
MNRRDFLKCMAAVFGAAVTVPLIETETIDVSEAPTMKLASSPSVRLVASPNQDVRQFIAGSSIRDGQIVAICGDGMVRPTNAGDWVGAALHDVEEGQWLAVSQRLYFGGLS